MRINLSKTHLVLVLLFLPNLFVAFVLGSNSAIFRYSGKDLESCVDEFRGKGTKFSEEAGDFSKTCLKFYETFLKHYYGDSFPAVSSSSPGYIQFMKTAQLVDKHNKEYPAKGFTLRLNRFADSYPSSLIRDDTIDGKTKTEKRVFRNDDIDEQERDNNWQVDIDKFWEHQKQNYDADTIERNVDHLSRTLRWKGTDVRLLDTFSSIVAENKFQNQEKHANQLERSRSIRSEKENDYLGSNRNLKWKKSQEESPQLSSVLQVSDSSRHHPRVTLSGDGKTFPAAFSSPQVPADIQGMEVELLKDKRFKVGKNTQVNDNIKGESSHHKFLKSLDWSTSHNPDGVPLVHGAFDQGSCGSCWAFAATGSVEASAARNTARNYFVEGLAKIAEKMKVIDNRDDDDDSFEKDGYSTMLEDLTEETQKIELDTFKQLNLSIQELLDCDTSVDEGCVGGNPLLSFRYIHEHGLLPWRAYPYVGYGRVEELQSTTSATATSTNLNNENNTFIKFVDVPETTTKKSDEPFGRTSLSAREKGTVTSSPICRKYKGLKPIASVESWGLLKKNFEDLIQYALLFVGPVAVGINAADPSFVNYGGGIYDSKDCEQTANHALLIVGYGEDEITSVGGKKESIRYWIARNSWGSSWGENGFVRVKRGSGEAGVPGVCGIARSPSVALGGTYRPDRTELSERQNINATARYRRRKYGRSYETPIGMNNSTGKKYLNYNRILSIFFAFICLVGALFATVSLMLSLQRQRRVTGASRNLVFQDHCDEGLPAQTPQALKGNPRDEISNWFHDSSLK